MAEFFYEGVKEGRRVKGKLVAASRKEAVSRLKGEGVVPLSLEPVSHNKPIWKREFRLRGPSEEELSFVLLQLSVLIEAGISLARALELVASQTEDERVASALLEIKGSVERGEPLSSAFRRSGLFPEFLSEMLTAAETGENLERIFAIAGKHLETVADMKSRIVGAITYPSVVIGFSIFALFVAIKFVVPKIAKVLEGFGRELPLVTKVVILLSDMLTYALYLSPLIVLAFFYRGKLVGRERMDKLLLKIPVVGKVGFYFNISRFAYTLYMTLLSAVPITNAFRIATGSVSNTYIKDKLEALSEEIERGRSVSWVLRRTGIFPPLFVNLVETGENSGELERMLKLASEIYKKEALRLINLWVRMIEPVSILIIGVIVGVIVVSVLLPLTEITSGIRR
ncbi:type II secretion system F family protein [Hydrogenivirga sp. 128-5-R1-1]|uniref:type II secretion system F family protein n=1 Tax=Hydrogenivirga sp. 128-5-R1-1 TaxID=392423 RepID=UPI00015EF95D|nr:type II secretion system F family protein [Hydrogenivirga sp. 128-5-R1-1]EDP75150.1 fimbrial assembly protein PilC2 [Hydrogenivirga sp. 128-5-R1-1]